MTCHSGDDDDDDDEEEVEDVQLVTQAPSRRR